MLYAKLLIIPRIRNETIFISGSYITVYFVDIKSGVSCNLIVILVVKRYYIFTLNK